MPVKLMELVLAADPAEAEPMVMVWAAYEPPVTSVPADPAEPLAVMSRAFSGVAGSVSAATPLTWSSSAFAVGVVRAPTGSSSGSGRDAGEGPGGRAGVRSPGGAVDD